MSPRLFSPLPPAFVLSLVLTSPSMAVNQAGEPPSAPAAGDRILAGLDDPALREIASDVLARNPRISEARARARAARLQAPQVKALPDPVLSATSFASRPETRVGPQTLMGTISQRFPWFGKLSLREKAAFQRADGLDEDVEALRLNLVTEVRRLYYEAAFLDAWRGWVAADRQTLVQFEEMARSRYASGGGIEQSVVKIQAEITRDDLRLLDIASRRASLVAALNALRDLPQNTPLTRASVPDYPEMALEAEALRTRALSLRPELKRNEAEIARADTLVDLARKEHQPDVTVAASYTLVGSRNDPAGLAAPPLDNGKDVFSITASINLPLRKGRLRYGIDEAVEARNAASEGRRSVVADIDRSLGELVERISLTYQQLRLLEGVLGLQADQSLRSAQTAYAAGTLSSLDLLDAERVLLEVRTARERARADYAIAIARLEGAVGEPLKSGGVQP